MNYLDKVEEFHKTFKAPVLDHPQLISKKRAEFRIRLIQEELDELKEAVEKDDLIEVGDALTDLQYVLSGAILEFGMKDVFRSLFAEVHRSNMSKACRTEEEAQATMDHYKKEGVFAYKKQVGEKWFVYRDSDDKLLKSVKYSPADLKEVIETSLAVKNENI